MPCSMMSFCCLMTSYCSGWSAWEAVTEEETVESSELMLSLRPACCSGSFISAPSLSDGCSWPANVQKAIRLEIHLSCTGFSYLQWYTLTQVGLKVWIHVHVFAPLHHTLKDGHQTLQALFTQAQLLWIVNNHPVNTPVDWRVLHPSNILKAKELPVQSILMCMQTCRGVIPSSWPLLPWAIFDRSLTRRSKMLAAFRSQS